MPSLTYAELAEALKITPTTATFPVILAGRLPYWLFRGLLNVHSRCGPHGPLTPYGAFLSKCFRSFVAS
jgi:hypothetical protein